MRTELGNKAEQEQQLRRTHNMKPRHGFKKKTKNLEIKKMGQDRRPRDFKYNYHVLSSKVESS